MDSVKILQARINIKICIQKITDVFEHNSLNHTFVKYKIGCSVQMKIFFFIQILKIKSDT